MNPDFILSVDALFVVPLRWCNMIRLEDVPVTSSNLYRYAVSATAATDVQLFFVAQSQEPGSIRTEKENKTGDR